MKHSIGQIVEAVKDGERIQGEIVEVIPEMEYEIKQADGSLRVVDHAHILTPVINA